MNLEIILDRNERYIKSFKGPIDVTLIEIIEKDNISGDKYLVPDLNYKNGFNNYLNNNFYILGNPQKNVDEAKYILHYEGVSDFTQILTPDYIFNQGSPLDLTKPFTETVPANTNLQLWVAARNSSGVSVAKAITFKTKP